MLQIEELPRFVEGGAHALGAGQVIETDMARLIGLKVFRIQQAGERDETPLQQFGKNDADYVAASVKRWYDFGRRDMDLEVIRLTYHGWMNGY